MRCMSTIVRQLRVNGVSRRLNLFTEKRKPVVGSNARSLEARLTAIRAAIAQAEDLKQKIIPADEVAAQLAVLRETIPSFETYAMVEADELR